MGDAAVKKPGGLAGITAGETAIATVGKEGAGLTYRGYDIYDLAEHAVFEEVAYLLHYGKLPNSKELKQYKKRLAKLREVPKALRKVLVAIPKKRHPMDVLRTGCPMLGTHDLHRARQGAYASTVAYAVPLPLTLEKLAPPPIA